MSAFFLTTYPVVKNLERFRAFHDVINTIPSSLDWITRSSSPFTIRGIKMTNGARLLFILRLTLSVFSLELMLITAKVSMF